MPDIITRSTSSKTMDVNPILLHKTSTTKLYFYPRWVSTSANPLRGGFRFEKKGISESWQEYDGRSITTLHKDEVFELNLSGKDMVVLFENLETIKSTLEQSGHHYGQTTFRLENSNAGGILIQIGDIANREFVIEKLRELETNNFNAIENAVATAKIQTAIDTITGNLDNSDENFWQQYFEHNSWILQQIFHFPLYYMQGHTYVGGKNTRGNGQGGVITDYLLKNGSNGSFAVVEIKTPTKSIVGGRYRGDDEDGLENVCYSMSPELSGGIVQLENQIRVAVNEFHTMLGSDFRGLNQLDPIGILLIGNRFHTDMNEDKRRSFSMFRKAMRNNIIMTYDGLLKRLEIIKGIYSE